jgi:hypothetical protein
MKKNLLRFIQLLLIIACFSSIVSLLTSCNPCPALWKCRYAQSSVFNRIDCIQHQKNLCCQYSVYRVWCLYPMGVFEDWMGGNPYRNMKCMQSVVGGKRCQ